MEKLRLIPISTKYCNINCGEKTFEIWRKEPGTEATKVLGTAINYDDAVMLLSMQPPVVSLVPVIKDGKYVSQLKAEDQERVDMAQRTGLTQMSVSTVGIPNPTTETGSNNDALVKALAESQKLAQEQAKALATSTEALTKLQEEFASFKAEQAKAKTTPVKEDKTTK